jgi:hypothetical protein
VKQRNGLPFVCIFLFVVSSLAWCQDVPSQPTANDAAALTAAVHDLQQQVQELRSAVADVRSEAAQYRHETDELRRELEVARQGTSTQTNPPATESSVESMPAPTESSLAKRVDSLEETTSLINDKVNEQAQTRVESGSKYHVRLSGLMLMNLFDNHGGTDNSDIPSFAVPSVISGNSNFGATVRQSEIGLEVFGPDFAGAKISGSMMADFSGGFPDTWNGVDSGIFRLLTANVRMDWKNTAIVAGQDSLFISPSSPTSFASIAIPTFNYAGNLWAWTPQVRIEHEFHLDDNDVVKLQGGILDNLTGDFPLNSFDRTAQGGERSGQPAYAARASWTGNVFGEPITLGTAAYYSRENWLFGRNVDGWAGLADWDIPLGPYFSLSGEAYNGRAIAGLNGGVGRSVLFSGDPTQSTTTVFGLHSRGGWSQLKLKATSRLEFNAALGLDNPDANDARNFAGGSIYVGPTIVRNVGSLGNIIYRPRSNVILSTEYRHISTAGIFGDHNSANQLNMIMGILF